MAKQVTAAESKTRTPRASTSKNTNLVSFVDAVTPEPKIVLENFLRLEVLSTYLKTASTEEKVWIQQMIDIALSTNKQEEFLSLGEKIALNTLRRINILV